MMKFYGANGGWRCARRYARRYCRRLCQVVDSQVLRVDQVATHDDGPTVEEVD